MDWDWSEEQELMRQSLRDYVRDKVTPNVLAWEAAGEVPRSLFTDLAGLGVLGLRLSPEYDGGGQDFWFTVVLLEELMRCGSIGVPVSVMAHAEFATMLIDRYGSPALRETYVRGAATGRLIGALGVSEPDAGSDVAALRTRAVRDGDDYVIDGSKLYISNGTIADYITLAVRTGGAGAHGISMIVVPGDSRGLQRRRLRKLGTHASDTAELFFEGCRVPAANLLGAGNDGFGMIMSGFEGERLVLAVMACSHARLMFDEAREWGHSRRAFGQPLLGFQVWQHRLADVLTRIEAAEALTRRGIDLYVRGRPAQSEITMAKLFATESARHTASECAQIQGGLGYMEECLMGRLHRDALAMTIGAGSSEIMRGLIARANDLVAR
ncbi:MAG: acyl-CoA dehydrogenase family protein [Burkholderiaceae bacterium]|nr:acyl-CoA dehydrogenase family protein [Burkholderiaceae bacterium]MEB2351650.1 acyl-CoA dehydrogenase family protein [Burkholderiaceae bacterium]